MALSKERTIFLGVLVIAGISLIVDRGFMGGPKGVSAGIIEHIETVVSTHDAVSALGDMQASSDLSSIASLVEQRLSADNSSDPAPILSESDITSLFFPVSQNESRTDQRFVAAAGSSVSLPELSAIMPGSDGLGTAILSGDAIRVGAETQDGFLLVRVVDRSVVLRRNDREYQLTLPVFGRANGS